MNKKCDKYEGYFIFANEADFNSHLEECEDCRSEHLEQQKISNLIKGTAFAYKKRDKKKFMQKIIASVTLLLVLTGGLVPYSIEAYKISQNSYNNYIYDEYAYDSSSFLYDEYGLVQI